MNLLNNIIITFIAILVLYEIVLHLTGNTSFVSTIWKNLKQFSAGSLHNSSNKVFNKLMPVLSANVNKLSNYLGSSNLNKMDSKSVYNQYPREKLNDAAKTHLDRNNLGYTNYDHKVEYNLDPIYHSGWENFVRPQPKVHTEYNPAEISHNQAKMEPWNYMSNSTNEQLVEKTGRMIPTPTRLDSCDNYPQASNETIGNQDTYENQLVQNYNVQGNGHESQQLNHLHDETHYQRHFDREPTQVTSADRYDVAAPQIQRGQAVGQDQNLYFNGNNVSPGIMLPKPILKQMPGANMQYSGDVRENSWIDVPWEGGQPDNSIHYKTRNLSETPNQVKHMDSSDFPLHLSHKPAHYNNRVTSINDHDEFENQYVSESMGAENMPRDSFSDFY